jgi:hypothetical protein
LDTAGRELGGKSVDRLDGNLMRRTLIPILCFALLCELFCACSSQQTPAENKEMELLRKETELAKKETELTKKELELSKDTANSNASNANSNGTPAPPITPTTVTIRFEPVWINGVGSALFDPNTTALVTTSVGHFSGSVNARGVIAIDGVPCNEQITIAIPPTAFGSRTKTFKRFMKCDKSRVNLGKLKVGSFDDDWRGIIK